jgi:hypothetical protein
MLTKLPAIIKGQGFDPMFKWSESFIDSVIRPRKCLGYKTPFKVFAKMTGKDYFLNGSVALMG